MKTNVGVTIAILNANNQVVNNRHARAITKELLVCRLCIILLSLYELMVEINIIHLALFSWPDANIQLSSKVLSVSAVLKS